MRERLCMSTLRGGSVYNRRCIAQGSFRVAADAFDRQCGVSPVEVWYVDATYRIRNGKWRKTSGGYYRTYIDRDHHEVPANCH